LSEENEMSEEPTNKDRLAQLEEAERKDLKREYVDLEKARNLLKVSTILKAADEKRRIYIEEMKDEDGIPYYVDYCMLNTSEVKEVLVETNAKDKNLKELFIRVRKADPTVTEEDIRKLPDQFIQLILLRIRGQEDYRFLLPAMQRNLSTLKRPQTPR
jgi:hypothetical protein